MKYYLILAAFSFFNALTLGDLVNPIGYSTINVPITPFSNMASGYQATNPGFRLIIRSSGGQFLAGGPLTMDAVIRGKTDDASQGSAYGRLILSVDMMGCTPSLCHGIMSGKYRGLLSICMAKDINAPIEDTECKSLSGNIHPERPFQWLNVPIEFMVENGNVTITSYSGNPGEGGTSKQLSLAVFHPAYGFAAPGKAFKDYQSPLVLDLDRNSKLDLINVWNEERVIRFDMNGAGQKVRTGWVSPVDGMLFIDDGSGCVKNGIQLLGEYTGSKDGNRTFLDGFEALSVLMDKNKTGRVVTAEHPELKVWRNWGVDGVCRPGEVYPASQFVSEILLSYDDTQDVVEDNEVRQIGKYIAVDGTKQRIGEVWFKQRWNDGSGVVIPESSDPSVVPVSSSVTNRRPMSLNDIAQLRAYASTNSYYLAVNITEGMRVAFSASYGMGGEAGQASGIIVKRDGKFWFKQKGNPTSQLMLAPGMPFNQNIDHSLWDLSSYLNLINRVAFNEPNEASKTSFSLYGAPGVSLVDFKGGTSNLSFSHKDALEVVFNKKVGNRSNSSVRVYYVKSIGPVAIEFQEDRTPSGTFKMYLGQ